MALDYCLSHNYFWYLGKYYTQIKGVAMGAKFAPSLAHLFMSAWEDKFIYGQRRKELLFYRRCIDDLFFIWTGSKSSLISFVNDLNDNNIKLECQWSRETINYLDVTVMLKNHQLETKCFSNKQIEIVIYRSTVDTIQHG